jgi:glycosyltransferase involved in cell wall biosynthesis
LKILLVSRCPPYPLHLGDRLIPYHLAQQLSARDHSIDLLAFFNQPGDPADVPHYRNLFRTVELVPEPVRSGESYIVRLLNSRRQFPQRREQSWSPRMWDAIERHLATETYDVVQLFGGIHVYEYRDLVKRIPNLIVPYESYSLYLERLLQLQKSLLDKVMLRVQLTTARRYERLMFEGYGGVVVLSDVDRQALLKLNSRLPIHVIPNGVDSSYFAPQAAQPEPATLLFVGNFEYGPNVDAALWLSREILPAVQQQIPAAKLLLVGNNPPASLQALASPNIEITRRVPDIRPYMDRSTLFISPLRLGAGIKNKVLEAMSMQKALVATPLSCDGINLTKGKNVLYGNTGAELANAAVRLLQDVQLREKMAQANRQFIEINYTWERVANQYEAIYADLSRKTNIPAKANSLSPQG